MDKSINAEHYQPITGRMDIKQVLPEHIRPVNTCGYIGNEHWFIRLDMTTKSLLKRWNSLCWSGNVIRHEESMLKIIEILKTETYYDCVLTPLAEYTLITAMNPAVSVVLLATAKGVFDDSKLYRINKNYHDFIVNKLKCKFCPQEHITGVVGIYTKHNELVGGIMPMLSLREDDFITVGELKKYFNEDNPLANLLG